MPRRRRRRRKQVGFPSFLLFLGLAVGGAAVLAYAGFWLTRDAAPEPQDRPPECSSAVPPPGPPAVSPAPGRTTPGPLRPAAPPSSPRTGGDAPAAADTAASGPAPAGTRVALVIDDLGRRLEDVQALELLGVPVTYAVLPFETRTREVVREIQDRGSEVLLHLPMEGQEGANPGPGALRLSMSEEELELFTRAALDAVPGAVGVNNHMGSLLSTNPRSMRAVLGVLRDHDLFFLDSRTTRDSVAYRVASELGVPAAERQVFLDREATAEAVTHQFRRLLRLARERGSAIAIGHPYPVTLEVLAREVPRAAELGYEFVPVSFLVERSGLPAR